jgi:hypothetical protein
MSMAVSSDIGSAPKPTQSPFTALLRIELGRAFGRRHVIGLAVVALMGVLLAFWLPTFPESVHRFSSVSFNCRTGPRSSLPMI